MSKPTVRQLNQLAAPLVDAPMGTDEYKTAWKQFDEAAQKASTPARLAKGLPVLAYQGLIGAPCRRIRNAWRGGTQ